VVFLVVAADRGDINITNYCHKSVGMKLYQFTDMRLPLLLFCNLEFDETGMWAKNADTTGGSKFIFAG